MSRRHVNLVDAGDLITWAERLDSQSGLPKLVRRLILASAKALKHASFRAGEGVQVGGWDGITVADAPHAFVPEGTAGWELSARKDVKKKADEDYVNRLKNPDGLDPSLTTFIFVTPKRWAGKHEWAAARAAEGKWRAVLVYDADDLETWLEATPPVHTWLSLTLGKQSEDAVDLDTFWADWSQVTRPSLTRGFLLAGRQVSVEAIHRHLRSVTESFAVRAESPEESLAVFTAAVYELPEPEREEYLARTLVVRTHAALDQLAASAVPLILIPLFDDAGAISRAVRRGHRIVIPAALTHPDTATTVMVSRLSVDEAERSLVDSGLSKEKARELAMLGRRSLMALRRKLAIRPEVQQPAWARPENAPAVLPFLLAGAWSESSQADGEVLGALAQTEPQRAQERAVRWSRESDPPVRSVGNIWYLASKEDGWALLAPALTRADLERFETAVLTVLGTPSPRFDVPAEERWLSLARPPHSPALRQGLAETLAIMGGGGSTVRVGGIPTDQWARGIGSRALLEPANADWRIWASLSHLLPLIAEAAPQEFLSAVERGLMGDQPLVKLFQEQGNPLFTSSPHTGLLWALERLAWSSDHLALTALVLAKLARLDPGGKVANRPRQSLRETFLLWHPQTSAPWERQLPVLRMLLDREPELGWQLHADLLPRTHDSSMSRTKPEWRDWAPEESPVLTIAEHASRIRDLVSQMLTVVGRSGRRWSDLVGALPNLPPDVHDMVTERLEALNPDDLSPDDSVAMWAALRQVLAQHRSFPDAEWALPKGRTDRLDTIYRRLQPADLFARYAWLFGENVRLPEGGEDDWEVEQKAVAEARRDAIQAINAQSGTAGIEDLIERVENPLYLGAAFGACGLALEDEDRVLRKHLASEHQARRAFALGYVAGGGTVRGRSWVEQKFKLEGLSGPQRADVLTRLPSEPRTWEFAREDPAVDEAYWKHAYPYVSGSADDVEYAAKRMIRYGRAYTAAELLAFHLKDPAPPSAALIVDALEAVLAQKEIDSKRGTFSFWAGKLLDAVASAPGIDESRVARLEWGFAVVLSHDRSPTVLSRELSQSPEFFVELLTFIYRRENDEPKESSEADQNRGTVAYHVLESWKSLPGASEDAKVDAVVLEAWVNKALATAAEKGRSEVGAQHVGKVLSHGPTGADSAWPHEAVRDVIEKAENEDVERGFEIGKFNSRGVVTRSLAEGGRQEQLLADQYAGWAAQVSARWPRTAAMLRRMEATYREEARREDAESDLLNEGFS